MKPVLQATSLTLALLFATGAQAANPVPAPTPEARAAELAAAQADLQRAARRVAELTRGTDAEVRAQERVAARMARRQGNGLGGRGAVAIRPGARSVE